MKLGKLAVLLVIAALAASSLTMVNATSLQDLSKPSAPEFTVKIVAYPYDVPNKTTTTVDQYTGEKTTTTTPGYHVENKSIEVTIKNPSFTPIAITQFKCWDEQNNPYFADFNATADLYFALRVKGHFGDDWQTKYPINYNNGKVNFESKYTVITIGADYPKNSQLDFQVKASIGFFMPESRSGLFMGYRYYGIDDDWSNTQVLTVGEVGNTGVTMDPPTSTPAPTATLNPPSTPHYTNYPTATLTHIEKLEQTGVFAGFNWETTAIAIMGAIIVGLVVALVLSKRSHKPRNSIY
jgi:hypothetical protein